MATCIKCGKEYSIVDTTRELGSGTCAQCSQSATTNVVRGLVYCGIGVLIAVIAPTQTSSPFTRFVLPAILCLAGISCIIKAVAASGPPQLETPPEPNTLPQTGAQNASPMQKYGVWASFYAKKPKTVFWGSQIFTIESLKASVASGEIGRDWLVSPDQVSQKKTVGELLDSFGSEPGH